MNRQGMFKIRQRANGYFVAQCRVCGEQEVQGEAAWAERLISLHIAQTHDDPSYRVTNDYTTKGAGMEDSEALLTGTLMALLMQNLKNPNRAVRIASAEPIMDSDGNYSNMIRVGMESGAQLIIHVTETNP